MRRTASMRVLLLGLAVVGSGCGDDETSDEAPLVFECGVVDEGQSLNGTATLDGAELTVRIESNNGAFRMAPTILDLTGGTLDTVTVKDDAVRVVVLGATSPVSFLLDGRLIGPKGDFCDLERSFTVTLNADGATVN